jgi:hypothetical protein
MAAPKILVPTDKECKNCGETFRAETSYQIRTQVFCGRKCRSAVHGNGRSVKRETKNCLNCGKEIEVLPCHSKTKKYCSRSCCSSYNQRGDKNGFWRGGTGVGGRYWKRKARERDNFTCQYTGCGKIHKGGGTHAHHKIPLSVGGESCLDNLITLCSRHHKEIEGKLLGELISAFPKETEEILTRLYRSL